MNPKKLRLLIAAGGTGGHLFPALAVAQELKKTLNNNFEAQFVGSANKIEAKVVPSYGYPFTPIPISGYTGLNFNAFLLPFKIFLSIARCKKIISELAPNAVLCTGAYISYPAGLSASIAKIPLILMESNVNPGKTIKLLSPRANLIITSFDETTKFFPENIKSKIIKIGNPIRNEIIKAKDKQTIAQNFEFDINKKTVLIFGGSLGAKSLNLAVENNLEKFATTNIQFIWQTGSNFQHSKPIPSNFKVFQFINDMASAYALADLVISRAGATTIAEITAIGKPSILVPLASASNNEQYMNAELLEKKKASIMIHNDDISNKIFEIITNIINDNKKLVELSKNALALGNPEAGKIIANLIIDKYYH